MNNEEPRPTSTNFTSNKSQRLLQDRAKFFVWKNCVCKFVNQVIIYPHHEGLMDLSLLGYIKILWYLTRKAIDFLARKYLSCGLITCLKDITRQHSYNVINLDRLEFLLNPLIALFFRCELTATTLFCVEFLALLILQ